MTVGQCRTECKDLTCQKVLSDCCFLSGLLSGCRHETDCRAVGLLSYVPGSVRGSDIYTVYIGEGWCEWWCEYRVHEHVVFKVVFTQRLNTCVITQVSSAKQVIRDGVAGAARAHVTHSCGFYIACHRVSRQPPTGRLAPCRKFLRMEAGDVEVAASTQGFYAFGRRSRP